MPDLDTQLRDYFDHVVQRVEADDILVEEVGAEPRRPPFRRGVWIAATSAVVTLLLFGLLSLLVSDDEISPADSVVVTTSALSTSTTLGEGTPTTEDTSTAASPTGYDAGILSRLSVDEPWRIVEWQILSVELAAAEDEAVEFLAVARINPSVTHLPADTRIWVSPDGESWSAVELPDAVVTGNSGPFTGPVKVAAGGPGLVAVGVTVYDQDCFRGAIRRDIEAVCDGSAPRGSAVWTSQDAIAWTRVDEQPAFDGAYMYSVAAGNGTLVAVGFVHDAGSQNCDCVSGRSVVWTSQDGIAWSRLTNDDHVFGQSVMFDVTFGPNGFIAVGWKTNPDWNDPVFWHSIDGVNWNRIDLPDEIRRSPGFVGVKDDLYVAETAGLQSEGGGLWWSPDGLVWTRQTAPRP